MATELISRNSSQNPDQQKDGRLEDDITHTQEKPILPDRLPPSLIEWLARINKRYLSLNQDKPNDTS